MKLKKRKFKVEVPGSKSITNRALLLAALAKGKSTLKGTLFSEDSRVFLEALKSIGYQVNAKENAKVIVVNNRIDLCSQEKKSVYVGSAGTAARFLTAMLALSGGTYDMECSEQMRRRPMRPLLEALETLGVKFEYKEEPYQFPFSILGREENGKNEVSVNIDESSQFLSALLMAGVLCEKGLTIRLTGKRSAKSYVGITMKMMESFGVKPEQLDEDTYYVPGGAGYVSRDYQIEPDVSAACYFYALAAITGESAIVKNVTRDSMQGDIKFLDVLERMGCLVYEEWHKIVVEGPEEGTLLGVEEDLGDFSDQTMTLAAIAPFAKGTTIIKNVAHIRKQESDRIHGTVTELERLGIQCEERDDGMVISPGEVSPAVVQTYNDHRMAMAFAILACRAEGVVIDNPACCRKTFENFFDVLVRTRNG